MLVFSLGLFQFITTGISMTENQIPEDMEYLFQEEDLLRTINTGPRIFNLISNAGGSTIVGFVTQETEDSFLVAVAVTLLKIDEKEVAQLYIPAPFFRLMKTSCHTVVPPFGIFKEKYDEYLKEQALSVYPELKLDLEMYFENNVSEPPAPDQIDTEELARKLEDASIKGSFIESTTTIKH